MTRSSHRVAWAGEPAGGARRAGGHQPASPVDAGLAQLQQLAALHDQGVLTDEEFTAAKRRLLGL